jgi:subtilase family serine protease
MQKASIAASLGLSLVLASCSGGAHSTAPIPPTIPQAAPTAAPVAQSAPSAPVAYGAETTTGAVLHGPAKAGTVDFGVLVTMRDPVGLVNYAREVNDPHSSIAHQWLTPDQIADRYGATQANYTAVANYFHSKGLAVMGWRQRELLRVSGSQANAEAALGSRFGSYTKNGRSFNALMSAPAALAKLPISALPGVSGYNREFRQSATLATPFAGSGYAPQQLAAAFDFTGAYAAGYTGAGVKLGIIGTGPIDAADLAYYEKTYDLVGKGTVTEVDVTNAGASNSPYGNQPAFATPPPTTDTCTIPSTGPSAACNPEDGEAQLDTQQAVGLAHDASVLFYLAYTANDGSGSSAIGIDEFQYEVQQAISDDKADVVSMSLGEGELDDVGGDFNVGTSGQYDPATSPGPMAFATLSAMGVAIFASSGDWGAFECIPNESSDPTYTDDRCVSYPAVDPSIVGVGGINTPLAANGQFIGPATGWGLMTGLGQFQSASGGGASKYFPIPAFQEGAPGVSGSTRNSPDVSMEGDTATGVAVVTNAAFPDIQINATGGTSVAAPEMAAMWALVLQACKQNGPVCSAHPGTGGVTYRLGNPNQYFYPIYDNAAEYAATFTDILFGNNSQLPPCADGMGTPCPQPSPTPIPGYSAGKGYDRVTGIGVPAGRALIKAAVGV